VIQFHVIMFHNDHEVNMIGLELYISSGWDSIIAKQQ
jgi:hypothetical protein